MSASAASFTRPPVGFIGLGRMGAPMARNLAAAGVPLLVWNRSAAKAEDLARDSGCEVAASPAELAERCEVVISMVADGRVLDQIYFEDPAFAAALAGGVAVDMSTIGPEHAAAVAQRLGDSGVAFVEAPVSGSVAAAEAATLTILAGAAADDFATVEPLLAKMGSPVLHLGEVGTASLMKLAINSLVYGINQCLSEAVVLAERGGVDRGRAYEAILESAVSSPVISYRREAFLRPEETPVSFTLLLEEKDLRLTTELGQRLESPMPQAELNRRVVQAAIEAGHGEKDIASIAQYLREEKDR
jgi:3-hydroxyisobutyrate dehydrogenase-like beta-hydroxyacid dehydrogenase